MLAKADAWDRANSRVCYFVCFFCMSVYILKWLQESTPKSVDILHVVDPQHALTLRSKGERLGHYHLLCCCTCCILSFLMYCCPFYLMCLMYCWWLMLQKLALHVTSYGIYDNLSEELLIGSASAVHSSSSPKHLSYSIWSGQHIRAWGTICYVVHLALCTTTR